MTDPDTGVYLAIAMNGCGGQLLYFASFLDALDPDGDVLPAIMTAS